ncbi:SWF/SNF family helicase [Allonocardiopsis opalescens]|uniref:SWIM-type domain-containing protein n=1 Tax=Allonocardiopsis opalescens TaxID=1144618 RepID=A0A2T0Q4P1_9ACTN|nr:SWF/SNF family helicase [Allonocardiopsis opalescens]PRX98772.1 hypothetical protein CLV72_104352 [Allonocardiopsis opalescens]
MSGAEEAGRVRGFAAFAPGAARAGRFARSWWGNAWVRALEDTSLDAVPLRRGRRFARLGQVGPITVSPGRFAAPVHGADGGSYRCSVAVEELSGAQWERFLDQVAASAGHVAALLERDMPHELVAAAADAGVPLLPGIGDVEPECDCDAWELPCEHAAALCFQVAWLLDADPFVLLLARGRSEAELRAELARRSVRVGGGGGAGADAGVVAAEVFGAEVAGLPPLPGPVEAAEAVAPLVGAGPAPGVEVAGLVALAADAAARARAALAAGPGGVGEALWPRGGVRADAARWAAGGVDEGARGRLAAAAGATVAELEVAAAAWRVGGAAGWRAAEELWEPEGAELARAEAALEGLGGGWVREANRWSGPGGVQLRWGADGRWYAFSRRGGVWWPAGAGARDPQGALAAAGGSPGPR